MTSTTTLETSMPAKLPDPRPVDGRDVHPAASAWYDPADHGVVAYRRPDGMWSTPYGGPFHSMADAIRIGRHEVDRWGRVSATVDAQAARIREVEGNFARAEAAVRELELAARDADKRRGDLQRDLNSARAMVRLCQWLTLAAGVVGYALASVGGAG